MFGGLNPPLLSLAERQNNSSPATPACEPHSIQHSTHHDGLRLRKARSPAAGAMSEEKKMGDLEIRTHD